MTPAPKRKPPNPVKIISILGGVLGLIWVSYQIVTRIYADIQANRKAIIEQAKADALRQADRNAYRLRVENRFEEDEKRIKKLEERRSH